LQRLHPLAFKQTDPPRKRWTRDDCAVLEREGLVEPERYELIEGELILKMPKNQPHTRALTILAVWLRSIFGGMMVVQGASIDLNPEDNPTSAPEPDAIVLIHSFLELSAWPHPEDLLSVVEVSGSSLTFDLTSKARLYARSGIAEYWVLDLEARRLIVHREPVGGAYRSIVAYCEEERVTPLAAPGRDVRVGDLI
jgi:Uma2 family endonuclease